MLLDVLGLIRLAEYYPLHAESVEHKFYELAFLAFSISLGLLGLFPAILPVTLLRSFGYAGAEVPDLLNKIYKARQTPLNGPLIATARSQRGPDPQLCRPAERYRMAGERG